MDTLVCENKRRGAELDSNLGNRSLPVPAAAGAALPEAFADFAAPLSQRPVSSNDADVKAAAALLEKGLTLAQLYLVLGAVVNDRLSSAVKAGNERAALDRQKTEALIANDAKRDEGTIKASDLQETLLRAKELGVSPEELLKKANSLQAVLNPDPVSIAQLLRERHAELDDATQRSLRRKAWQDESAIFCERIKEVFAAAFPGAEIDVKRKWSRNLKDQAPIDYLFDPRWKLREQVEVFIQNSDEKRLKIATFGRISSDDVSAYIAPALDKFFDPYGGMGKFTVTIHSNPAAAMLTRQKIWNENFRNIVNEQIVLAGFENFIASEAKKIPL